MAVALSGAASSLFDFPHSYPISDNSFGLGGLGQAGRDCGANRLSHFASDGSAAMYSPLRCRRAECPECFPDWMRRTVYRLAMMIEAYAEETGERPYHVVFSVPPNEAEEWNWERVNTSLFRRGYRRAVEHAGVDGGAVLFHPYRVKKRWKLHFRERGVSKRTGFWKEVRERVRGGDYLQKYVKLGPHLHGIVFGEPKKHSCPDYLIKFPEEEGAFKRLDTAEDVVHLLFYLVSHVGHLTQLRDYDGAIQRRRTRSIRTFGCLHHLDPSLLTEELAREIAELITVERKGSDGEVELLPMETDAEQGLIYPAFSEGTSTSEEDFEWVPIYRLGEYVNDRDWLSDLDCAQQRYWLEVLEYMIYEGAPPDFGNIEAPDAVEEFACVSGGSGDDDDGDNSDDTVQLGLKKNSSK